MELALNEDQCQILDAIDGMTKSYASVSLHDTGFALLNACLDREIEASGFLDVMAVPELGRVTAAMVVERLARQPFALESAASSLVRPLLDPDLQRPICLIEGGQLHKPVRFLKAGATVVLVNSSGVYSFTATDEHVSAPGDESLFAYPVAYLTSLPENSAMQHHDVTPEALRTHWRIALAAEAAGLLAAALAITVTYVSDRKQFGRPLAAFQALRHRLAEAQVVTNGCYWLMLKAASSGDTGDAALAAVYAQESARRVTYDYHQFLGAMGMTLEHPLHLWTYRLKALIGELGGRGANALAAASAIWGPPQTSVGG